MSGAQITSMKVLAKVSLPVEKVRDFVRYFGNSYEIRLITECPLIKGNREIEVLIEEQNSDFFQVTFGVFCKKNKIPSKKKF
uniref:Uncharacterized protein n=1 Tax=candidate division CPR3 bacterium TaxID=2268181 RepID=A0A7C4R6C3_UNCC3